MEIGEKKLSDDGLRLCFNICNKFSIISSQQRSDIFDRKSGYLQPCFSQQNGCIFVQNLIFSLVLTSGYCA